MDKTNKGKIVWKDNLAKDWGIWYWLFLSIIAALILFFIWDKGLLNRLGFSLFLIVSLYCLVLHLTATRVTLSLTGILLGDLIKVRLGVYKIKKRNIFVSWDNVKSINFENYLSGGSYVKNPRPFLVIRTKDKKKYIYTTHDITGFLKALRKINRHSLISKNLRYR